jgi:hypothetical protein
MSKVREFNFERARRVTPEETEEYRKAIERKLGIVRPPRGRPPKGPLKFRPIQIRIHPKALLWAKLKAKKQGIGYQTVINQTLLHAAGIP